MTYNSVIYHEQGGSVLVVGSGGSLNIEAGGTFGGAAGTVTAGSLTVSTGGVLNLGANRLWFAASTAAPSGLPVEGTAGDIFLRIDGANSAGYVNTGNGTSASVWTIFSEL